MQPLHTSSRTSARPEILDGEQLEELRVVTTRQVEQRVEERLDGLVDLLVSDRLCSSAIQLASSDSLSSSEAVGYSVTVGSLETAGPTATLAPVAPVAEKVELSIVLPCFNEAETLGEAILKIQFALERVGQVGEVLVADLGSFDDSVELAEQLGARVVHVDPQDGDRGLMNSGAGRAILAAARGKVIVLGSNDSAAISQWF